MGCLDGNWRVSGEWPETRRGLAPTGFAVHARLETGNNALPNVEGGIILSFASKSDNANGTYKPALQALGAANLQD